METLVALKLFILGSAIGSFLSVVIYRLRTNTKGIIGGRSKCPACKTRLKWQHMVPIFSWIYLRGRCADCGKNISSHYMVMELTTGLLFVLAFIKWNFVIAIPSIINPDISSYQTDWQSLQYLLFYLIQFTFLSAIFYYDLMYKEIPDRLSIPAILIALTGGLLLEQLTLTDMIYGAIVVGGFFFLQFIISGGKWIGGGDIRLGVLMGFLLGLKFGLLALMLSYLTGGLLSIYLLMKERISGKTEIAFGPFLIAGTLIAIFWGERILNWYFSVEIY